MNRKQQGFVFRCERQLHKEFEFISCLASHRLNMGHHHRALEATFTHTKGVCEKNIHISFRLRLPNIYLII